LKARAIELVAAGTEGDRVLTTLDQQAGYDGVVLEGDPPGIIIHQEPSLVVALIAPYSFFRSNLSAALRRRAPVDTIEMPLLVRVNVSPFNADASDIVGVAVERDGRAVGGVSSTLKPTTMNNMFFANTTLHRGVVGFDCGAFAPGGDVKVIATSASGQRLERAFTQGELRFITGLRQ
jgi:hypothetical protein